MQLAPPQATQSPERLIAASQRERSVIARISAQESSGADDVGPLVTPSGPLSLGLSQSKPHLPPLRPHNGETLPLHTHPPKSARSVVRLTVPKRGPPQCLAQDVVSSTGPRAPVADGAGAKQCIVAAARDSCL